MPASVHHPPYFRHIVSCTLGCALQPAILLLPVAAITGGWQAVFDPAVAGVVGMMMLWALVESLAQGTSRWANPANRDDISSLRSIDRRYRRLAWASSLSMLLALWMGIAGRALHTNHHSWLCAVGLSCMAAGIALRVAAIRSLGVAFRSRATVTTARMLRTTGIHGWLRHPSEAGLLLIAAGAAMALDSICSAGIAAFVLLPSVLGRIAIEDAELRRAFGQPFDEYCRRVPSLTPRWSSCRLPTGCPADLPHTSPHQQYPRTY